MWRRPKRSIAGCGSSLPSLSCRIADDHPGRAAVLINLQAEPPPFFSRFERLAEIVGIDEADAAAGRVRFRFYRERGYEMRMHNLGER